MKLLQGISRWLTGTINCCRIHYRFNIMINFISVLIEIVVVRTVCLTINAWKRLNHSSLRSGRMNAVSLVYELHNCQDLMAARIVVVVDAEKQEPQSINQQHNRSLVDLHPAVDMVGTSKRVMMQYATLRPLWRLLCVVQAGRRVFGVWTCLKINSNGQLHQRLQEMI
jgi:hypothetical protein